MLKFYYGSLVVFIVEAIAIYSYEHKWHWKCNAKKICEKTAIDRMISSSEPDDFMNIETCQLVCMDNFGLWPLPHTIEQPRKQFEFVNYCGIQMKSNLSAISQSIFSRFYANLKTKSGNELDCSNSNPLTITAEIANDSDKTELNLDTDETYKLSIRNDVSEIRVSVMSANYYGFRLALETLEQLFAYNDITNRLVVACDIRIVDGPKYPYRGVMLDVSRNFLSIASIKRTLEAMAINKMNTLHLHLSDSHSFPFYAKSMPNLTFFGAYSKNEIYYEHDIAEIASYAKMRGIRIVPELDGPAHVGEGWQRESDLVVCFNQEPWTTYCVEPPCGQFNPTSDRLYEVLGKVYGDMLEGFRSPKLFHMGGDEINNQCWNSSATIQKWMSTNRIKLDANGFLELWHRFQEKAFGQLQKIDDGINAILWTSKITDLDRIESFIPKDKYIIQIWDKKNNTNIRKYLQKGYRVILSNYDHLYLDCGFGGWVTDGNNWCSPYKQWQKLYDHFTANDENEIFANLNRTEYSRLILGSEAPIWSEQVDDASIDSRLWPRVAALAERLWTRADLRWQSAEERLLVQRERLVRHGIRADALKPQWCYQNKKTCNL